ncbi:DUF3761 domain-containing protein [Rhodococcus aetherivorans]
MRTSAGCIRCSSPAHRDSAGQWSQWWLQTEQLHQRRWQPHSRSRPGTTAPTRASARCDDGTYSFSQNRSGTCSGNSGVDEWLWSGGGHPKRRGHVNYRVA